MNDPVNVDPSPIPQRSSLWVVWTFTILLNWVAFFWIGIRAQNRRWVLWGLVYAAPLFTANVLSGRIHNEDWAHTVKVFTNLVIAVLGIISIGHALAVRSEYSRQRNAVLAHHPADALVRDATAGQSIRHWWRKRNRFSKALLVAVAGLMALLVLGVVLEETERHGRLDTGRMSEGEYTFFTGHAADIDTDVREFLFALPTCARAARAEECYGELQRRFRWERDALTFYSIGSGLVGSVKKTCRASLVSYFHRLGWFVVITAGFTSAEGERLPRGFPWLSRRGEEQARLLAAARDRVLNGCAPG